MGTLQQIHRWSLSHHPRWLVVLRVILGICLFFKGIFFLVNTATLEDLSQVMIDASICGLGQAAPNPIRSVRKHFAHEIGAAAPSSGAAA